MMRSCLQNALQVKIIGKISCTTGVVCLVRRYRNQRIQLISIFFLAFMVTSCPIFSASFDCEKAALKPEKVICSNPVLSTIDEELSKKYTQAIDATTDKQLLAQEQRKWINNIRNKCTDTACLGMAYQDRIAELNSLLFVPQNGVVSAHGKEALLVRLEDVKKLLVLANSQLKSKRNHARDAIFFNGEIQDQGTDFCKQFWKFIGENDLTGIPDPVAVASNSLNRKEIFNILRSAARSNFNLYLSQNGNLEQNKYTGVTGRVSFFVPARRSYDSKLFSKKFNDAWRNDDDYFAFFHNIPAKNSRLTYLVYMQPFPIAGYSRPLLIALIKDNCNDCTGFSIGIRIVSVDGFHVPMWEMGMHYSQKGLTEYTDNIKDDIENEVRGTPSYSLMGLGVFNEKPILWTLRPRDDEPLSLADLDYYNAHPDAVEKYYRANVVDVYPLDDPSYSGPDKFCTIRFN